MDYLVTRLTGYTKEDALAVVDRCRNAYAGTDYVIVLDDVPGRTLDWMHDPVGNGNDSESASSVLIRWGFEAKMFDDDTDLHVIGQDLGLNKSKVLLYCSHGTHSHGIFDDPEFILNVLDMGFLPGALFNTYESYNGWSFRGVHNSGQELLQDFISVGGTGGSCNVYEPWNVGCMDESITFAEYLHCGRNLAEACYKGIRFVSWMNCVVGDPLTAVIVN